MVKVSYTVKEIGDGAFEDFHELEIVGKSLPSSIDYIGLRGFKNCKLLQLDILPPEIKDIEEEAFMGCEKLGLIRINGLIGKIKKRAFYLCSNLDIENLPPSITEIGESAFEGCKNLTLYDKKLPSNIKSVGTKAFKGCSLLKLELLSPNLLHIGEYSFEDCNSLILTTMGDNIETVGKGCFKGCPNLKITDWPKTIDHVPEEIFDGCANLQLSYITSDVNTIGKRSFRGCHSLKLEQLGEHDTLVIQENAFENAKITNFPFNDTVHDINLVNLLNLDVKTNGFLNSNINIIVSKPLYTSLLDSGKIIDGKIEGATIRATSSKPVTKIDSSDDDTFKDDDGIIYQLYGLAPPKAMIIGTQKKDIEEVEITNTIFYGKTEYEIDMIKNGAFQGCISFNTKNLPFSLRVIEDHAFDGCVKFKDLFCLPDKVKVVGAYAFKDTGISFSELPDGISQLGEGAFQNCTLLNLTTIPIGIKVIPKKCFSGCTNMALKSLPEKLTTIEEAAFQNCIVYDVRTPPKSITKIETLAFENVYTGIRKHEEMSIPIWNNVIIDQDAFKNCDQLQIRISQITYEIWSNNKNLEHLQNNQVSIEINPHITHVTFDGQYYKDKNGCIYSRDTGKGTTFALAWVPKDELFTKFFMVPEILFVDEDNTTEYPVISILPNVFKDNTILTEITIPPSIQGIGESAFEGCINLRCIKGSTQQIVAIQRRAFFNCKKLELFTINNTIKELPDSIFENCNMLNLPTLPGSIEYIGNRAFYGCENLVCDGMIDEVTIKIGNTTEEVQQRRSLNIKIIGNEAFFECKKLTLKNYEFNDTQSIGANAFFGCRNLDLSIHTTENSSIIIGLGAFSNSGILSGNIRPNYPDKTMPAKLFYNVQFNKFEIDCKNLIVIGESAFEQDTIIEDNQLILTQVQSITDIGPKAFKNVSKCTLKDKDDAFSGVKKLYEECFYSCTLDNNFNQLFPSVEYIDKEALYNCKLTFSRDFGNIKEMGSESISRNILEGIDGLFIIENEIICKGTLFSNMVSNNIKKFVIKPPIELKNMFGTISNKKSIQEVEVTLFQGLRKITVEGITKDQHFSEILEGSFDGLENMTKLTINLLPSTINNGGYTYVTSIGKNALRNCKSLKQIDFLCRDIPINNPLFYVNEIEESGFENCEKLEFPHYEDVEKDRLTPRFEYIERIEEKAFKNCCSLISLGDTTNLTPDKRNIRTPYLWLYKVGNSAFDGCTKLKYPILPYGGAPTPTISRDNSNYIKIIKQPTVLTPENYRSNIHYDDKATKYYVLDDNHTKQYFFNENEKEPNKIVSENCFCNCTSLVMNVLPYWIHTVENKGFYNCKNLNLELFSHSASIGSSQPLSFFSSSFENALFPEKRIQSDIIHHVDGVFPILTEGFSNNCFRNTKINFYRFPSGPQQATFIGEHAFENCSNLTLKYEEGTTVFPNGLHEIHDYAFHNCAKINFLSFGQPTSEKDGITIIRSHAFQGCISLVSNDLPPHIQEIGDYAFEGCKKLNFTFYDFKNEKHLCPDLEKIGAYAFSGCTSLMISSYLPPKLTIVEEGAFQEIIINDGLSISCAEIRSKAFYNCRYTSQKHSPTINDKNILFIRIYLYNNKIYPMAFGCDEEHDKKENYNVTIFLEITSTNKIWIYNAYKQRISYNKEYYHWKEDIIRTLEDEKYLDVTNKTVYYSKSMVYCDIKEEDPYKIYSIIRGRKVHFDVSFSSLKDSLGVSNGKYYYLYKDLNNYFDKEIEGTKEPPYSPHFFQDSIANICLIGHGSITMNQGV